MRYVVEKHRIWVHQNEVIDSLEIYQENKRKFYSYTYKERRGDEWYALVRWDNLELQPHIDRYDENALLVEQLPFRTVRLKEVESFVGMFRKGLLSIDVAHL